MPDRVRHDDRGGQCSASPLTPHLARSSFRGCAAHASGIQCRSGCEITGCRIESGMTRACSDSSRLLRGARAPKRALRARSSARFFTQPSSRHFADHRVRFHVGLRRGQLVEGEHAVDERRDRPSASAGRMSRSKPRVVSKRLFARCSFAFEIPKTWRRLRCTPPRSISARYCAVDVADDRHAPFVGERAHELREDRAADEIDARFAPLPPVASRTCSAKFGERVSMPTSSPIAFSFSSFSAEPDVPIVRAPSTCAVRMLPTPTPDDAPATSSHSPARELAVAARPLRTTVRKLEGIAAACSHERRSGVVQHLAFEHRRRIRQMRRARGPSRDRRLSIRSRLRRPRARRPDASLPPSFSAPPCTAPPTMSSPRLSPAACTRMTTSAGFRLRHRASRAARAPLRCPVRDDPERLHRCLQMVETARYRLKRVNTDHDVASRRPACRCPGAALVLSEAVEVRRCYCNSALSFCSFTARFEARGAIRALRN